MRTTSVLCTAIFWNPKTSINMLRHLITRINQTIVLSIFAAVAPTVFGGTVITANLPANTAIINIGGTQDGAAISDGGDQPHWYEPFYTGGATQLLEYTVQPGTYSFRIVNPADAASLFPSLTSAQTSQIFTAWTYNSPWVTDYLVFDSAAATDHTQAQLFDGAMGTKGYSDATSAYNGALADGTYDEIRTGPLGRDSTIITNAYTFTTVETLIFTVPDYGLSDNGGGVSVVISPVNQQPPLLSILPGTDAVTLLWPTNAFGFNLEQNATPSVSGWSAVAGTFTVINTNYSVTLPIGPNNTFFRLQHP
jgi:hypothetical protein